MAEGNKILGKVAFVDKGAYNAGARYDLFNFVTTEDSCYLSLKDGNTGHPVTDTDWWKCLANGKQATEAAKKALAEATRAGNAADNLYGAAQSANEAAVRAGNAANDADTAKTEARQAAGRADTITGEASRKIVQSVSVTG